MADDAPDDRPWIERAPKWVIVVGLPLVLLVLLGVYVLFDWFMKTHGY